MCPPPPPTLMTQANLDYEVGKEKIEMKNDQIVVKWIN